MKPANLVLLLATALLMATSNLLVKSGLSHLGQFSFTRAGLRAAFTQPLLLSGMALVFVSGLLWFYLLSREPMTTVYPIFVGATYVLIVAGSIVIFRESVLGGKGVGIVLVLAGILLITRAA